MDWRPRTSKSNAVAVKRDRKSVSAKKLKAGKEKEYGLFLLILKRTTQQCSIRFSKITLETVQRTELLSTAYRLYQLEQVYKSKEASLYRSKNNLVSLVDFYKTLMLPLRRESF
jgi:hypothetical protein